MKKSCAVLLCAAVLLLCGCWDQREMSEIGIVAGVAIDQDAVSGKSIITIQVVLPGNLQKDTAKDRKPYKNISGEGATLFDAERNLSGKYARIPFFHHNQIIIISEAAARNGVKPILDLFSRDMESDDSVMFAIAKGTTAREVLTYDSGTEKIPAIALRKFYKVFFRNPGSSCNTILEFNQSMHAVGINPVAGVFSFQNDIPPAESSGDTQDNELQFCGSAVFADDKLLGFLDKGETTAYHFLKGDIVSAALDVPGLQNKTERITIQILHGYSRMDVSRSGTQIACNIALTVYANIGELNDNTDVTSADNIEKLEEELNQAIRTSAESVIAKTQADFRSDIFGIGQTLYRTHPADWKAVAAGWDTFYPNVRCSVTVKSTLIRSGMTNNRNAGK